MILQVPIDQVFAQGAGQVKDLVLHIGLYESFAAGGDGLDTGYAKWLEVSHGKTPEQARAKVARLRKACEGPLPTEPLPVLLDANGRFELLDGHHRATRAICEGRDRLNVELKLVSPLWQKMVDDLASIYPDAPKKLYQEIEHPYFDSWSVSRSTERIDIIKQAIKGKCSPSDGNYVEIGSCTGRIARDFFRDGWRCFGLDLDRRVVSIAEYLNRVFGTNVMYVCSSDWRHVVRGGIGLAVCLSVLHSYHTAGEVDFVKEKIRELLHAKVVIIDGDVPGREYRGGVAWPEEDYRKWLEEIASQTHSVKSIGCTEGRTIYMLEKKTDFEFQLK